MPPSLAKLHQLLEQYTEEHEEGFFMAEQDQNRSHQAQPVLVFIAPESLRQDPETAPKRAAPDWIGEILNDDDPREDRIQRYAKAGVKEYWRIDLGLKSDGVAPARIEVHTSPQSDGSYTDQVAFVGKETVVSERFPGLALCPQDLA
jgi:Uma2 family endonuclease